AIETVSRDPSKSFGGDLRQTLGSYNTGRTFVRLDSGNILLGGAGYVSYTHQQQKAWDFDGRQGGDQVNAKYVREDGVGKLTAYVDWNTKTYPNEDAIGHGNQQTAAAASF
ncbi:hypothetical protein, partial [Acinetobacter soli]|uniref:hypothetical protein n=1 Tax=Acinetobacter soli TaxID=487316 RepID=UPI00300D5A35